MREFVDVKIYKRSVGKRCLHCARPARVTAIRKITGKRLHVRYCHECATTVGVPC